MSGKAYFRKLNGKMVVFRGFKDADCKEVLVFVYGEGEQTLSIEEWDNLPVPAGVLPAGD